MDIESRIRFLRSRWGKIFNCTEIRVWSTEMTREESTKKKDYRPKSRHSHSPGSFHISNRSLAPCLNTQYSVLNYSHRQHRIGHSDESGNVCSFKIITRRAEFLGLLIT